MSTIVIGVDNGNGNVKTSHVTFPCGYFLESSNIGVFLDNFIAKMLGV